MSGRPPRDWTKPLLSRTTQDTIINEAGLVLHECSTLIERYKEKEGFTADVPDKRLVTIALPSTQLDTKDKLRCLHSALLQCSSLLESAITKEKEELGSGNNDDYEKLRTDVKYRLSNILSNIGELLKAVGGGTILTPDVQLENVNSLFELKLWVYQVYKEVAYWTNTTITTVQSLKEKARTTGTGT